MYSVARLSDGSIRIWGNDLPYSLAEYSLPIEGVHWQEIEAYNQIAGRSGPESSYVRHGAGCGGSLPASELIPLDTPRIGDQFDVTLTNLPNDVALLGAGLSATGSPLGALPLPLDPYGAPGCMARISWDAGLFLAGAHHFARASIAVPNMTALIGLRFYHQAIVLDPSANAAGFVVSDATVAVVGE